MEQRVVWIVVLVETLFAGGLMLLLPRITRRGLLFGVYVGERAAGEEAARDITRGWYFAMVATLALTLVALLAGLLAAGSPALAPLAMFILLAGFAGAYLRAHFRARELAPASPPPPAAAVLIGEQPRGLVLPLVAIGFALLCGTLVVAYTAAQYPHLPARIPVHFDIAGRPDGWSTRSFGTVMVLPLMTLVLGAGLGGMALLVARAKRAVRTADGGVSLAAQLRFRGAMTAFLSVTAMLATAMLAVLSVMSLRVALGQAERLSPLFMILTGVLLLFSLGGSVYIALRYGQGGARLERSAAGAPLTDGLADNRRWLLGMFYFDREDPSIFVENRFGLGYTMNFGNWRAWLTIGAFMAVMLLLSVIAIVSA
ncbi:MAG: DUF1648 domain-containing protein [Acidobacteria bacterium]|nr:DUF1648 domain-containing protein [Acidobacteriota bacterium]